MLQDRKKGGGKKVRVVAERREVVDRDLLSVALFGWTVDKVRADRREAREDRAVPSQPGHLNTDDGGDGV